MDNFIYNIPTKVYFGKNSENELGKILISYHCQKVLIVYGQGSIIKNGLLNRISSILDENNIKHVEMGGISPNPTLKQVYDGISLGLKNKIDFVLAIGGGSVMDASKDIANGIANPNDDVWDYHLFKKEVKSSLPKGVILTISASGSEMSDSCVITNTKTNLKKGYCSDFNRFNFAIENPELTYSVNKYQTACGIVDIAMHSIERYFDLGEASLTDDISLSIIKNVFKWGKVAFDDPNNYEARANLMWASSLSHNGLTHKGKDFLLTVHQLEHALSGLYPEIAHGAGLAALWSTWARNAYKSNTERWRTYVEFVWNIDFNNLSLDEGILKGIQKQEDFYKSIEMPISIKDFNIKEEDLELLTNLVTNNGKHNIRGYYVLGKQEIYKIFKESLYNND